MTVSKQWLNRIERYWQSDEGQAYALWLWDIDYYYDAMHDGYYGA